MELWLELQMKMRELDACLRELRKNGSAWAQAEHDYKVELYRQTIAMKDKGVAATIVNIVCRGIPKVAKLRLERDMALVTYKANVEAINIRKLQCRLIDNQIGREFGNPETRM